MEKVRITGSYLATHTQKEKFEPQGKYEYDVFYTLDGEMMTGHTKGDNQKQAKENFYVEYEERAKIQHFQGHPLF